MCCPHPWRKSLVAKPSKLTLKGKWFSGSRNSVKFDIKEIELVPKTTKWNRIMITTHQISKHCAFLIEFNEKISVWLQSDLARKNLFINYASEK